MQQLWADKWTQEKIRSEKSRQDDFLEFGGRAGLGRSLSSGFARAVCRSVQAETASLAGLRRSYRVVASRQPGVRPLLQVHAPTPLPIGNRMLQPHQVAEECLPARTLSKTVSNSWMKADSSVKPNIAPLPFTV